MGHGQMLCVSKVEGWLARQRAAARSGRQGDCVIIRSSGHPVAPEGRPGGQPDVRLAGEGDCRRSDRDQQPDGSGPPSGAPALRLHLVMIAPGTRGCPHRHDGRETAVFMVSGEAEVWYGPGLAQRAAVRAGDVMRVGPGTPHLAVNRGVVPAIAVVAGGAPADLPGDTAVDFPPHLAAVRGLPSGGRP
jgi:uncharacterized RmlC-like cupin family protein